MLGGEPNATRLSAREPSHDGAEAWEIAVSASVGHPLDNGRSLPEDGVAVGTACSSSAADSEGDFPTESSVLAGTLRLLPEQTSDDGAEELARRPLPTGSEARFQVGLIEFETSPN